MVDIDLENFLPQRGFKIDIEATPTNTEIGQTGDSSAGGSRRLIQTNTMTVMHLHGEEGEGIPWHTHTPTMDQFIVPTKGRVKFWFKDNDGETHEAEVGEGESFYLPPGAHNKDEIVEGPAEFLLFQPRVGVNRLDFFIEGSTGTFDDDTLYDPHDLPHVALEYDNLRGTVIDKKDEAVTEV